MMLGATLKPLAKPLPLWEHAQGVLQKPPPCNMSTGDPYRWRTQARQHQEEVEHLHEQGMIVYYADATMANNQAALAWCVDRVAKKEVLKLKAITSPLT